MSSCSGGIGHCTSLQELLLGFSSGALRLISNQDDHLLQGVSCVEGSCFGEERNDEYSNAKCVVGLLMKEIYTIKEEGE